MIIESKATFDIYFNTHKKLPRCGMNDQSEYQNRSSNLVTTPEILRIKVENFEKLINNENRLYEFAERNPG